MTKERYLKNRKLFQIDGERKSQESCKKINIYEQ